MHGKLDIQSLLRFSMRLALACMPLAVLLASLLASASPQKVDIRLLIVSNSVDLDAAVYLRRSLEKLGYWNVSIVSADLYPKFPLTRVDVIMILGGPLAYEGVGLLSSAYLPREAIDELMKPGSLGYWIVEVVDKVLVYVIIAGHTRVETRAAVDLYLQKGLQETYILVAVELAQPTTPALINQLSKLGLHPVLAAEAKVIGEASLASMPEIAAYLAVKEVTPAVRHIVLVKISQVIP